MKEKKKNLCDKKRKARVFPFNITRHLMSCVGEGEAASSFASIQRNLFYEISQWNNILCTRGGGGDDIFGFSSTNIRESTTNRRERTFNLSTNLLMSF